MSGQAKRDQAGARAGYGWNHATDQAMPLAEVIDNLEALYEQGARCAEVIGHCRRIAADALESISAPALLCQDDDLVVTAYLSIKDAKKPELAALKCLRWCVHWKETPGMRTTATRRLFAALRVFDAAMQSRSRSTTSGRTTKALSKAEQQLAKSQQQLEQRKLKRAILKVMKQGRKDHVPFKQFIRNWQAQPIRGLSLQPTADGRYRIADEESELQLPPYQHASLTKMYSEALPKT